MQVIKDFHVHEHHSGDAPGATVTDYCRVAEERGFDEICFTTHFIIAGKDANNGLHPSLISEYIDEIESAQASTSVKLRIGLEVDYFPEAEALLSSILDEYPLDFVLGSLHYIRGFDIGDRAGSVAFFGGRKIQECLETYYEGWREAVESGLFDVMAHPDYFRKYLNLSRPGPLSFSEYGSTVYEAIDALKAYKVGFEVNPSGYRHGIGDCYPILGFLRELKSEGIDIITIGSDCHSYTKLGERLEEAVKRVREVGYSNISVFEDRRRRGIELEKIVK
ncbi:histidinol-phosphatase HisJ family protein [Candidatus Bathyarchaeota archaeon]|nr:histidinol-phosphatase HisJ family protein [Candidatus Bathyarchaeota archaeon]MBS7630173.1 histidinol-phosphatase HisJ family protein [Candidatus Bathyarchaeota archaeon]